MPLPKPVTKKISARAVYSRNAPEEEHSKGRGRPRKFFTSEVEKAKAFKKARKQTNIKMKKQVEENTSEADSSSEDEEIEDGNVVNGRGEDKKNKESHIDEEKDLSKQEDSANEESGEKNSADDVEMDEEEDVEADDKDTQKMYEDGETVKEIKKEELFDDDESDENVRYSLAEPVNEENNLFFLKGEVVTVQEVSHVKQEVTHVKQEVTHVKQEVTHFNQEICPVKEASYKRKNSQDEDTELINNSVNSAKRKKIEISERSPSASNDSASNDSIESNRLFSTSETTNMIHVVAEQMQPLHMPNSSASHIAMNKTSSCGNVAADNMFTWLINSVTAEDFFRDTFEKCPFHVKRNSPDYYKGVFSSNDLHTIFKENNLYYEDHVDVVKYVDGERIPQPSSGRMYFHNIWTDYQEGYSIRLRNPQSYNQKIWTICSLLQEYFSSPCGCNVYLTPAGAQGFAPHYDDIDGFIAQIEGSKNWKVYNPRNESEDLARHQSRDFAEFEIGEPVLEIQLNPGDLLYIPRGFIHQASTGAEHSLHLTFSMNQLYTWGDLLISASQKALERAILDDIDFRYSVPRNFINCAGVSNSNNKKTKYDRRIFQNKLKSLFSKISNYLDVNEAADDHAKRFVLSSLPPAFSKMEKQRSIFGNGTSMQNGQIIAVEELTLETEIQFIRKQAIRLVVEDSVTKIYHSLQNGKDRLESDEDYIGSFLDIVDSGVPACHFLIQKHPEFVKVKNLPLEDNNSKIEFTKQLYENGLLMTKEPLPKETGYDSD